MQYLFSEVQLDAGGVVEVSIDRPANVRLMDRSNYAAFRRGGAHRYYGGHYSAGLIEIVAPSYGPYVVVIDLASRGGTIRHSIAVRRAA